MKNLLFLSALGACFFTLFSCKKVIDINPISNTSTNDFYKNYDEVSTALTGAYNGTHEPLYLEWMMTELRSDNSLQGVPNSSAASNYELNDLDMFTLNASHDKIYDYWLGTYKNIRSINYVLRSLGVTYANGTTSFGATATATVDSAQRKQLAGEALFLRAYHYFNLVRLFGGVFLITEPVDPKDAKKVNRSSKDDIYNFILADINAAKDWLPNKTYTQLTTNDLGHANAWAAKGLLAKIYLTLNRKADALPLLNDIINNSGYALLPSYADVFSINNEMNREIIFASRYKAGGYGLGSPFANLFAAAGSGNAVVNNDGSGYNFPTNAVRTGIYKVPSTSTGKDLRKDVTIAFYTSTKPYVKKFLSQVVTIYDAENDFPILRFADVLLMKAEATGFDGASGSSMAIINQIRTRSGAIAYVTGGNFATTFYTYPATGTNAITTEAAFKDALLAERRLELAFENQRFFDMLRIGDPITMLKNHFAAEYTAHYSKIVPAISLATLQSNVTPERMILPIPQREIDTNDELVIQQNPGY